MEGFPKCKKFKAYLIFKYLFCFSSHSIVKCWYFFFQTRGEGVNKCKCLLFTPFFDFFL